MLVKRKMYSLCSMVLMLLVFSSCNKPIIEESSSIPVTSIASSKEIKLVDGVNQLNFLDKYSLESLIAIDGTKVALNGFMAAPSPVDGSYIYLMNRPYQDAVSGLDNEDSLFSTMSIYPVSGKGIEYTDTLVTATGTLKILDGEDAVGYKYKYKIIDAEIEQADLDGLAVETVSYVNLINKGFAVKFNEVLSEAYKNTNYVSVGIAKEDLKPIDIKLMTHIVALFDGMDQKEYSGIIETVDKVYSLVLDINKAIENKNWSDLDKLNVEGKVLFDKYYNWLTKPQV